MVKKITETRIIELFLKDYSRKIYLREAAKELKKPHQSIKPYIQNLIKKRIIIETKHGNTIEYSLNFKNKSIYDYLVISEKERTQKYIEENPLIKEIYMKLSYFFEKNIFIIFGSSTEKIKKSEDIDLLIIGKNDVKKEIKELEEIYSKKIHLIQTNKIKDLNMVFIKEIYKKHIIFNNTEEVIRYFGDIYRTLEELDIKKINEIRDKIKNE
jgi:predicted nucleotidyltransferase